MDPSVGTVIELYTDGVAVIGELPVPPPEAPQVVSHSTSGALNVTKPDVLVTATANITGINIGFTPKPVFDTINVTVTASGGTRTVVPVPGHAPVSVAAGRTYLFQIGSIDWSAGRYLVGQRHIAGA